MAETNIKTWLSSFEVTTKKKKTKPLYSDTLLNINIDAISATKVKPRVYYLHSVNALRIKRRRQDLVCNFSFFKASDDVSAFS